MVISQSSSKDNGCALGRHDLVHEMDQFSIRGVFSHKDRYVYKIFYCYKVIIYYKASFLDENFRNMLTTLTEGGRQN